MMPEVKCGIDWFSLISCQVRSLVNVEYWHICHHLLGSDIIFMTKVQLFVLSNLPIGLSWIFCFVNWLVIFCEFFLNCFGRDDFLFDLLFTVAFPTAFSCSWWQLWPWVSYIRDISVAFVWKIWLKLVCVTNRSI